MVKNLRDYQTKAINKILNQLSENNLAGIVSCVGSGKTLIASIIASTAITRGISKIIISTPFTTIEEEFTEYSNQKWMTNLPNNQQFDISKIKKSENVNNLTDVAVSCNIEDVEREVIATTHMAVTQDKFINRIKEETDLSKLLLIIDEAHHCYDSEDEEDKDATKLGEIAKEIINRNGKILYLTATPYREYQGKTVLIFDPKEVNPYVRTIGEQMRDGYAPMLRTEYVNVDHFSISGEGSHGIYGDVKGSELGRDQVDILLPEIIKKYMEDGCPKSILLIPSGNSAERAIDVCAYLKNNIIFPESVTKNRGRKTPSVLIAVGSDNGTVIEHLKSDKNSQGKKYDIIIGCRKFDEGTDVNTSSHLYMIGVPSNVRLFHQRAGRVLRDKRNINGYKDWFGEKWLSESKVVFFVPPSKKCKDFDYGVGRQLLHSIFASERYEEYCNATNIGYDIRMKLDTMSTGETQSREQKDIELIESIFTNAELQIEKTFEETAVENMLDEELNGSKTVQEALDYLKEESLSVEQKIQGVIEIANKLPEQVKVKVKEQLEVLLQKVLVRMRKREERKNVEEFVIKPEDIISEEFNELLSQYKDEQLDVTKNKHITEVFSTITGEVFKDWSDRCSHFFGESYAIKKAREIIAFIKEEGRYPTSASKDLKEKKIGQNLNSLKRAKKGEGCNFFYPSLQNLAEEEGLPNLFDNIDREKEHNEITIQIINFIKENNRTPATNSKREEEKILGRKLANMRQAKKEKVNSLFFESSQLLAEKAGLPNLFINIDREKENNIIVSDIIAFVNENNRFPSVMGKELKEKKLGQKLSQMRQAKKGKGNVLFYTSSQKLAEEAGYPNLFEQNLIETKNNQKTFSLIQFIKDTGRTPTSSSNRRLWGFLSHMRQAKKGKGKGVFCSSSQKIAEEAGYPDLFENVDREGSHNDITLQIIECLKNNKPLPSMLNSKLSEMVKSKQGKNSCLFYASSEKLAIEAGYPDLFETKRSEK